MESLIRSEAGKEPVLIAGLWGFSGLDRVRAAARRRIGTNADAWIDKERAERRLSGVLESAGWSAGCVGINDAATVVRVVREEAERAGLDVSALDLGRTALSAARRAIAEGVDEDPAPLADDPFAALLAELEPHACDWVAANPKRTCSQESKAIARLAMWCAEPSEVLGAADYALAALCAFRSAGVDVKDGEALLWAERDSAGVIAQEEQARLLLRANKAAAAVLRRKTGKRQLRFLERDPTWLCEEEAREEAWFVETARAREQLARNEAELIAEAERLEALEERGAMMDWATRRAGELLEADLSLCDQPPGIVANRLISEAEIELVDARLAAATAYRLRGLSVDLVGGTQAVVTRGAVRPLASTWYDSTIDMQPPRWLVKGLFTAEGLGLLFGESGAGKSFLAVHLALRVAYGLPFFGRRVRPGGVSYFAAEGGPGIKARFYAAEKAMGPEIEAENRRRGAAGQSPLRPAKIEIVHEAPNLSKTGEPERMVLTLAQAKAEMATAGEPLSLAILDTWHAAMGGGEENAAEDVGEALKTLRPASGDMQVLVVHHPGKIAERGPRGSNALPAAADTVVELTVPGCEGLRSKAGADRQATLTKLREGETGATFSYQLPAMVLGQDEDGDPWTTCYVQPVAGSAAPVIPFSGGDRKFEAAFSASEENGRAPYNRLRATFIEGETTERATAAKAFTRALDRAQERGGFAYDKVKQLVSRMA